MRMTEWCIPQATGRVPPDTKKSSMFLNPHRAGTELTRFNKVNIMAAGALAPYVARTSAALILIM